MTPEERWLKIENAIQVLLGSRAQHDAEIANSRGQIEETAKQISRLGEQMERKTAQIDAQIEKNTAAIRDLIVVSRALIDSQQATEKQIALDHSEIKAELELLIKAVNAFLKDRSNGNR